MIAGLGIPELIIILVIALVIFGPRKLPEVGSALGKAIREFKRGTKEIQEDIESATRIEEKKEEKAVETKSEEPGTKSQSTQPEESKKKE